MHVGFVDLSWEGHHTPYIVYLSQYFTDRGHDITFITDEANPRLDELPDSTKLTVRALSLPTTDIDPGDGLVYSVWEQLVRTRQLRRIFEVAREDEVDILHLLSFDRTQIPLWAATRGCTSESLPIVAALHRDFFTDDSGSGWGKRLTYATTRAALDTTLSDGTLSCLTVYADTIRDRIIESVSAATRENTHAIPAPTPPLSVDVSQAEAREYLGLPADEPIALFFGELREEKGPDLLAEALRGLDRPLTVVFAGPEDDFTSEDVDAWQAGIESPVRIINRVEFIPEVDLDYYFTAADVLVLPYRRRRAISGPLRRACAAGTPIIGNSGSDVGELIERNGLGWTFENSSASSLQKTLHTFLDKRNNLTTENLRRYAADHHWEVTGRALEELYANLLEIPVSQSESAPPDE